MPKDSFVFLGERIRGVSGKTLLDVGCDKGQFLSYLSTTFPHLSLHGLDISQESLEAMKQAGIPAAGYHGDIQSGRFLPEQKFDVITMTGVHSEFSDIRDWLWNLLCLGHHGSIWFVMGYFNPHPIDLRVQYKRWPGYWEDWIPNGLNIISCRSVLHELAFLGYKGVFTDFEMSQDIPSDPDDPLRAWTFKDEAGKRIQTNGASQIVPFKLLTITR